MTKLEDLEFADDLALLSHRLQDKVTALETTAQRVGLEISQEKTKLLRTNNQQEAPVTISGKAVEDVSEFVYLDSKMSHTEGTDEDIKARVKKACQAFAILKPVWRATTISTNTKLRIFNSVKSVPLYRSETWRVINTSTAKIQTFINGDRMMCNAPTTTAEEEDKDNFYAQLQSVVDKTPRRDMLILMGDMNTKVGSDNTDRERAMGRHGLGEMNEMLADFCATNNLVIHGGRLSD
nr:hypothetical protein BaRGS_008345 [Batillaria attramentaria]